MPVGRFAPKAVQALKKLLRKKDTAVPVATLKKLLKDGSDEGFEQVATQAATRTEQRAARGGGEVLSSGKPTRSPETGLDENLVMSRKAKLQKQVDDAEDIANDPMESEASRKLNKHALPILKKELRKVNKQAEDVELIQSPLEFDDLLDDLSKDIPALKGERSMDERIRILTNINKKVSKE